VQIHPGSIHSIGKLGIKATEPEVARAADASYGLPAPCSPGCPACREGGDPFLPVAGLGFRESRQSVV
jgi:hypothetical protein